MPPLHLTEEDIGKLKEKQIIQIESEESASTSQDIFKKLAYHGTAIEIGEVLYYPLPQNNELNRVYKTIDLSGQQPEFYLTRVDLCPDSEAIDAQGKVREKIGTHYLTEEYDAYDVAGIYYVTVSEFLPDCMSLKSYINRLESMHEKIKAIISIATLIGNMFQYFQEEGVFWTDLKYDNILTTLDKDDLPTIHVSDIKAMCTTDDMIYTNCTPEFRPPEIGDETGKIKPEDYLYFLRYTFGKMFESLLPASWELSIKADQIHAFLRATLNEDPKDRLSIYDALLFLTAKPTEVSAEKSAAAALKFPKVV